MLNTEDFGMGGKHLSAGSSRFGQVRGTPMAMAKRHYIPGHIWHITHRCHKREFLLKFAKDRQFWLYCEKNNAVRF